jgi:hypothetical protein
VADDIVEQLRTLGRIDCPYGCDSLGNPAADEIERLRAEVKRLTQQCNEYKEDTAMCDVLPCKEKATECHGGEIYFCQHHYEGAAVAQKAGIPVEKAYYYKS